MLLFSSGVATAQESISSQVTVEVINAFDFAETQAISFGTITVVGFNNTTGGATDFQATVVIPADGSQPSASNRGTADSDPADRDALITLLTPGQRGLYDIANAAPFTDLSVTLPAAPVTLVAPSAPLSNGTFIMDSFTAVNTDNGSDASATITTDVNGAAQLGFGATLYTPTAPASPSSLTYVDATYSGSYTIQVQY
jgi:hypothetical protein